MFTRKTATAEAWEPHTAFAFHKKTARVIPWLTLFAIIAPHCEKAGRGRRRLALETMRRVYLLQQWFSLSDPQAEDIRYVSESTRRSARVKLGGDRVPDESTILRFRHLLEQYQLMLSVCDAVRDLRADQRISLGRFGLVPPADAAVHAGKVRP